MEGVGRDRDAPSPYQRDLPAASIRTSVEAGLALFDRQKSSAAVAKSCASGWELMEMSDLVSTAGSDHCHRYLAANCWSPAFCQILDVRTAIEAFEPRQKAR